MDKKARIITLSIIFLLIITIFIFIVPIGSQGEPQQFISQVVKRTQSSETIRNSDGTYTLTLFSGQMFMDSQERRYPLYKPVSEIVTMTKEGNNLIISWTLDGETKKIIIRPKFLIRIGASDTEINLNELINQRAVGSSIDSVIIKNTGGYEYGYNITNLGIASNLMKNVYFDYIYEGINTTTDIKIENEAILLPDGLQLRFDDLKEEGFTFDLSNINRITIGNITGKRDLFLDPTITLQTANSENLKDSFVQIENDGGEQNSNFGLSIQLRVGGNWSDVASPDPNEAMKRSYISYNLSSLNFNIIYNITYANLSLYVDLISANPNRHLNISLYYLNDWINGTGVNILNETQITWNNQPCGIDFTNNTNCNLTEIDRLYNIIESETNRWKEFNVTTLIRHFFNNSFNNISFVMKATNDTSESRSSTVFFRSKEHSTTTTRPVLSIIYTPYIDIISPTTSQILTDNTPTNNFNISTAVNMSTCLWTNSSGVINYSMASLNTTYFFNNSVSNLLDGTHTVRFYCNETDGGEWRQSDTVTFDIDSVNVTTCRDLTVAGRNYTLKNNISSSSNPCIDFDNNDMMLNGNNNNITIVNPSLISTGKGIILIDTLRNRINNIGLYSITSNADVPSVNIFGGDDNVISNATLSSLINNGLPVLDFEGGSTRNNITNSKIISLSNNALGVGNGVNDPDGNNNLIDVSINSSKSAVSFGRIGNYTFINVTYLNGSESITSNSNAMLTRKWYFTTQINNTEGNPLQNANITITNMSNSIILSVLTDSNGQISRQEIIEYINNGTRNYHTPHTINVSLVGYVTNSTIINFTSQQNYNHIVSLVSDLIVNIIEPQPQTYSYNTSLNLNYTISNFTSLNTCWYYIFNSTNNYEISNRTITCNQNQTFNVSTDQTYTIHLHVNDSSSNKDSDSVTFATSTVKPAVALNYPSNNSYFNSKNNIYFNFTATDSNGLNTCQLYGDWTGTFSINYTWINPTNNTMNYTIVNISQGDGTYNWNVWCNDTSNNQNFALSNRTFIIDTIYPIVNLGTNNITTTAGSLSASFNTTYIELNCNNTFYSVFDIDNNINNNNENVSVACGDTIADTFSVSAFASYNLQVYVRDKAGNENSTRKSFNVQQAGGVTTTGGGGGTPSQKIPVIGIIQPEEAEKEFNELQREIIYAEINNFCSEKLKDEGLAIIDFSQECSLTLNNLEIIKQRLEELDIIISKEDLVLFYKNYKERKFFQGAETKETIDKYGLFSAVLGETVLLKFNPPSLDKFFSINVPDGSEHTISFKFTSNKPLKSCDIISNTPELSCIASNSSLIVFYKIANTDFIARIFSGTISGTTDAPQDKIETKNILLIFRVINIGVSVDSVFGIPIEAIPVYIFFIGGGILAIGLIIIFSVRKGKNPIKSLIKAVK